MELPTQCLGYTGWLNRGPAEILYEYQNFLQVLQLLFLLLLTQGFALEKKNIISY